MKTKLALTLSLLTLGLISVAVAEEYKTPTVGFKKRVVKETRVIETDVDDYYKYEAGMEDPSRQIASEESDRVPSSVVATDKKKPVIEPKKEDVVPHEDKPKMWYKSHQQDYRTKGKYFYDY